MRRALRADQGFTVIEMLIATVIMMAVIAATFTLMNPAQGMFAAQLEVSDMQQRLRIAVEMLSRDLMMAGAGAYSGSAVGSLGNFFASIRPYRVGAKSPDPVGSFKTEVISLMYVPSTASQTTIRDPIVSQTGPVAVNPQPGCPVGDQLCGFTKGMTLIISDDTGTFDTFKISSVQDSALQIRLQGRTLSKGYAANSSVVQVVTPSYWLKTDTESETYQLMHYDGSETDLPIADNVVGLNFEYFGEGEPAALRPHQQPPTTYGPKPPGLGVTNPPWPDGENCAFMVSGGQYAPRMERLGPANGPLVKLDQAKLTDGPWCPSVTAPNRWDVDLLRIRRIRVALRVQVATRAFRGVTGTLFTYAGTSRGGERFVPDQEITFDVTPRNMNLGR